MRIKALVMLLLFVITNNVIHIDFLDPYTLSLEDIRENPEKYLGERVAQFTVVNITLRPDPSNRLSETYYLVYIQDSFKHSVPFVIPEQKYQMYKNYQGRNATLSLVGKIGPALNHPPDRLITNILVSKTKDPYSREKVYVFIYLEGERGENKPPEASFTFSPANPRVRQEVQFTDASTDVDGQIASWYWEFGDGDTSSEKNPVHEYRAKGKYTTILTVTDDKGAEANSTQSITLKPAPIFPGLPPVLEEPTMWVVLGALAIISMIVITVIQRR